MYEEKKYSINWLKIFVTVIIGFLVIILTVKLVSLIFRNQESKNTAKTLENNLKIMNESAKSYFTEDKLPSEVGESVRYSLKELIDAGKISELKDQNGRTCSVDESFVEATKLDTEYQIKSYLACQDESDYLNTFIEDASKLIIITPETTTTTKQVETTKKVVKTTKKASTTQTTKTTIKTYTVSFNSNGGDYIEPISVREGNAVNLPTPVRTGYTFVGWYYSGTKYDTNSGIYKDIVLVAKWTK